MSHDARAVANAVLDHADALGVGVDRLALQKILFFLHGWWLRKTSQPLIRQAFEAWSYGPVVRVVYDEFKELSGNEKIVGRAKKIDLAQRTKLKAESQFTENEIEFIRSLTSYYARINSIDLMKMTHIHGGSWDKVFNTKTFSPGKIIDNHLIEEHFHCIQSLDVPH
jgi:uncharacterized phage-associated protein